MPCELMNPQRGHSVAVSLLFDTASVNIRAHIANKKRKYRAIKTQVWSACPPLDRDGGLRTDEILLKRS